MQINLDFSFQFGCVILVALQWFRRVSFSYWNQGRPTCLFTIEIDVAMASSNGFVLLLKPVLSHTNNCICSPYVLLSDTMLCWYFLYFQTGRLSWNYTFSNFVDYCLTCKATVMPREAIFVLPRCERIPFSRSGLLSQGIMETEMCWVLSYLDNKNEFIVIFVQCLVPMFLANCWLN